MKVAIAGYTGLIGRHLIAHLKKHGHEVVTIPHRGDELVLDERHHDVDAVINLSGINIMHRWSQSFKGHATSSRAGTSHQINQFYDQLPKKPKVFVSASAIGYYGEQHDTTLIESSPRGLGFLADLVEKWEKATFDSPIKRVVAFRLGMVLANDGGALSKLASLVKRRLGCIIGNPKSFVSWVHIDDVVKAFTQALERSTYSGIYNLVTEEACTQEAFMKTLGKVYDRKVFLRLPLFVLKLILGEAASVFADAKVYPKKLKQNDFEFLYSDLESALYSLKKRGL
jgi:uncharacterized protein